MNAQHLAQNRYTCKAYDENFHLEAATLDRLLEGLRLAPSSVNIQPWHFLVATSKQGKQTLATFAYGDFTHNAAKITNAAAVIVFATKTDMDRQHLEAVMETELQAGRFNDIASKNTRIDYIQNYLDSKPKAEVSTWLQNQVYLALGTFVILTQVEGLDATTIEGFDTAMCDEVLGLSKQGYHSLVMVAIGRRHSTHDFNATLPKARFTKEKVITWLP